MTLRRVFGRQTRSRTQTATSGCTRDTAPLKRRFMTTRTNNTCYAPWNRRPRCGDVRSSSETSAWRRRPRGLLVRWCCDVFLLTCIIAFGWLSSSATAAAGVHVRSVRDIFRISIRTLVVVVVFASFDDSSVSSSSVDVLWCLYQSVSTPSPRDFVSATNVNGKVLCQCTRASDTGGVVRRELFDWLRTFRKNNNIFDHNDSARFVTLRARRSTNKALLY